MKMVIVELWNFSKLHLEKTKNFGDQISNVLWIFLTLRNAVGNGATALKNDS